MRAVTLPTAVLCFVLLGATAARAAEPIKLGCVAALSGSGAAIAARLREGAEMAIAAQLEIAGRPVELLVRDSAKCREDAHLPALEAAMVGLQAAFRERNVRAYFEQNVRLTDQILLASGNATLRRLIGTIGKQALRYRYLAYSRTSAMMQLSVETNREIIDAIIHRHGRTARTLTEDLVHQS